MKTKSVLIVSFLCVTLGLFSTQATEEPEEIIVGVLIERVIAGEDFSGQDIIVRGIALNETTSGGRLVNLGTMETFRSSAHENYVSIYDVGVVIKKGMNVRVLVHVEDSSAYVLGGKNIVLIETAYRNCVAC